MLRTKVRDDVNYFLTDIADILTKTGSKYENVSLSNFQQCLVPDKIDEWVLTVRREIPRELDCFDYILAGLVRYFDK